MSHAFRVARLDDLPTIVSPDGLTRRPVRTELGIEAFGINAFTAEEPGQLLVEEHDELGGLAGRHEELYFVSSGRATFTVDGEEIVAPAGTFLFVSDPAARRKALAVEAPATVLVVGGIAGQPFRASPWEESAPAIEASRAGDNERAIELQLELIARYPDNGMLYYNLACFESLLGRRGDALDHLRRAIESDPKALEYARSDSDFDSLGTDQEFALLLAN